MQQVVNIQAAHEDEASGEFLTLGGERFYAIRHVDKIAPFFINVVSSANHWLFVSSTGGLTAGRVSPETALFPYITVDKIHHSSSCTGSMTMLRVRARGRPQNWEPFNRDHDGLYRVTRNLYKNVLGNKVCFEEVNEDLGLVFRHTWMTSDEFGFVRQSELINLSDDPVSIELLDGLQNVLPACTPEAAQANASNLVDAHKWTELDGATGLAIYSLYSRISDRAEPSECLKANTVFQLGLDVETVLLSSTQLHGFRVGKTLEHEAHRRGIRGAYFVHSTIELDAQVSKTWQLIADVERTQAQVVGLRQRLGDLVELAKSMTCSINQDSDELARIMGNADAFQTTGEENVTAHHYANVLFNVLRGGIFDKQYSVPTSDFGRFVHHFNTSVYRRNQTFLDDLPATVEFSSLLTMIRAIGDSQLERLSYEYLPIRFGRRHGDPSRPWNRFTINLKDEEGKRLLSFEGNWRDIFQNWEALAFSYPEFVENIIAKFVNASTMDGYNPYRITKQGIDWEIEEPGNALSNIGYWGDHQIIYLLKLLELSSQFHPARLNELLRRPIFGYANVPYRLKPFEALLQNPKHTVGFDSDLAEEIVQRVARMGADGKLILDSNGDVYQVNLLEKLLVPLLSKLGNLVIDGGIWLNTQRPEWNDANNALVGHGLSMVTLYYLRRYVRFLKRLFSAESESFALSTEVGRWLKDTAKALREIRKGLGTAPIGDKFRYASMEALGQAASRYRAQVYSQGCFSATMDQTIEPVVILLDDALAAIDHSIRANRRDDGLYHAYNLLDLEEETASIQELYLMLEGQVAALSSGFVEPSAAIALVEALFDCDFYRPDQHSFMLYPDRKLPSFLEKNCVPADQVESIPFLQRLLADGDEQIIVRDADGEYRFNADCKNVGDLEALLDQQSEAYGDELAVAREPLRALYEQVFNHKAFTGRSGAMFGFEGLGSIYWHMVAKLLLAIEENFFAARDDGVDSADCEKLGQLYYRVRDGFGFNKTPAQFGAFPLDPYSHTPKHAGARQPGMTGQVKEEILCRFGELGVRVRSGRVHFEPALLRSREFLLESKESVNVDVHGDWQKFTVPPAALAFTWCQVPVIYRLDDESEPGVIINYADGEIRKLESLVLSANDSAELFRRSGRIRQLTVTVQSEMLFSQ